MSEETKKRFRRHQHGFVYVVQAGDAIKIGFSADPERRIKNLQTSHQETLETLLIFPGSVGLEKQLHRRYAQYRIRGEWFHAVPHLVTRIKVFVGKRDKPPPPRVLMPEEARAELMAARDAAYELRRRRPDLKINCGDLIRNIELQLKEPDDVDLKRAYSQLFRTIESRVPADTLQ